MENASKALLIAGAILIAILLIAIGMMVFTNAKGVIDTAGSNMSDTQKQAFNQQFEIYNGTVSGSVLKDVISKVNTSNANKNNVNIGNDGCTTSIVTSTDKDERTTFTINSIQNQAQYDVKFSTNDAGLIYMVKITKH